MGRLLLIGAVAAALWACGPVGEESLAEPHADLACAACHAGPQGERGRATVPVSACLECHEDGGLLEVRVATVTFPHRDHAADFPIRPTCAGCHTHESGEDALTASTDACALCHISQLQGAEAQACRLCHQRPDHARLTSQGVAISHSALPWLEIGCVRCHYDVAEAETRVASLECRQCHNDLAALNQRAVGLDLHPLHDGLTCTSCHGDDLHSVGAISSAVDLVCSDCHSTEHRVDLTRTETPPSRLCAECHTAVHAPQQRLILGIQPTGEVTPSAKFLAGITCRSCHVRPSEPGALPAQPIRGQATACAGCHEQQYAQVLEWWLEGIESRLDATRSYVDRAERDLAEPASDSVAELLDMAGSMVELVADAGGQHNLELADRLLREAVSRAGRAYEEAGRRSPAPPDLGRVPHTGLCTYCHYRTDEPWSFDRMPADFHQGALSPR